MVCCATIATMWAAKVARFHLTMAMRRPVTVRPEPHPLPFGRTRWLIECEPRAIFQVATCKARAVCRAYRLARQFGRRVKIIH